MFEDRLICTFSEEDWRYLTESWISGWVIDSWPAKSINKRNKTVYNNKHYLGYGSPLWCSSRVSDYFVTYTITRVDQNNIKVNVEKTFSLDQASNALDYQKDIHPRGKVVLIV